MRSFRLSPRTSTNWLFHRSVNRDLLLELFNNLMTEHIELKAYDSHIRIDPTDPSRILLGAREISGGDIYTDLIADIRYMDPFIGLVMHLCGYPVDPSYFEDSRFVEGRIRILHGNAATEFDVAMVTSRLSDRRIVIKSLF